MSGELSMHLARARAVGGNEINLLSGSITMDEQRAPYVSGTLVVSTPFLFLTQLDPLLDARVSVTLTEVYSTLFAIAALTSRMGNGNVARVTAVYSGDPGSITSLESIPLDSTVGYKDSVTRRFPSLGVRTRSYNRPTTTLQVASDEALLGDRAHIGVTAWEPPSGSLTATINEKLYRALGTALASVTGGDATIDPTQALQQSGQSDYDYLAGLAQSQGRRLWCDELGFWRLALVDSTSGSTITLTATVDISALVHTTTRDGDEWADALQVVWSWTDNTGQVRTASEFATTPGWTKLATVKIDGPYPGGGITAQTRLAARMKRGRRLPIEAVSRFDAAPSQPAAVYGLDHNWTAVLSAITWSFPDNTMTITTREITEL